MTEQPVPGQITEDGVVVKNIGGCIEKESMLQKGGGWGRDWGRGKEDDMENKRDIDKKIDKET